MGLAPANDEDSQPAADCETGSKDPVRISRAELLNQVGGGPRNGKANGQYEGDRDRRAQCVFVAIEPTDVVSQFMMPLNNTTSRQAGDFSDVPGTYALTVSS